MKETFRSDGEKAVLREIRGRRWRWSAREQGLSEAARQRLEWMIFYDTVGQRRTSGYLPKRSTSGKSALTRSIWNCWRTSRARRCDAAPGK